MCILRMKPFTILTVCWEWKKNQWYANKRSSMKYMYTDDDDDEEYTWIRRALWQYKNIKRSSLLRANLRASKQINWMDWMKWKSSFNVAFCFALVPVPVPSSLGVVWSDGLMCLCVLPLCHVILSMYWYIWVRAAFQFYSLSMWCILFVYCSLHCCHTASSMHKASL